MKSFITILLIIGYFHVKCKRSIIHQMNVGTTLFTDNDVSKKCWTRDNVALLSSRRSFQNLLPPEDAIDITNENYIHSIIEYFLLILENIKKTSYGNMKHIILLALSDTLGGYLNHFLLPVTRYAYYCGFVSYDSVQQLYLLFEELKLFLKTTGSGWSPPGQNFQVYKKTNIPKYQLTYKCQSANPCANIIFYKYQSDLIIPLPYFDSKEKPVAIAVPLKNTPVRNIENKHGALILVKYYDTALQCLLQSKGNQSLSALCTFRHQFKNFLQEEVLPKLSDDKFYSAFGGVYRVLQSLEGPTTCLTDTNQTKPANAIKGIFDKVNGFVLLVVILAAIVWMCIGFAYMCICCRLLNKSKRKDYIRISCSTPSYVPKTDCGGSGSTYKKTCSKKSKESIFRRLFRSTTETDYQPSCKNKSAFPNSCNVKKTFIQNDGRPTIISIEPTTGGTCQANQDESDYYTSSTGTASTCQTTQSTKSSKNCKKLTFFKRTKNIPCFKSLSPKKPTDPVYPLVCTIVEKKDNCSVNSKESVCALIPNNLDNGTDTKESTSNLDNFTITSVSQGSATNICNVPTTVMHMSNPKSSPRKLSGFKYNFKYDLEDTTSSSDSSPRDPIWPHPVANTLQTSRMEEKYRKNLPTKRIFQN